MSLWDLFDSVAVKYRYKLFAADLTWRTSEDDVLSALTTIQVDSKDVQGVTIFEDPANGLSLGFCCIGLSSWRSQNIALRNLPNVTVKDWCPSVYPFSKRQFNKLISDAKSSGRMRVTQDDSEETEEIDYTGEKQEVFEVQNSPEPEQHSLPYQYVYPPTPYHYYRCHSLYSRPWPNYRYDPYRFRRPRFRRFFSYRGTAFHRSWERFRSDFPHPTYSTAATESLVPTTEKEEELQQHHQPGIHPASNSGAHRLEDVLNWNRSVSSTAISHAVMYAVSGQHQKSVEVLQASIDIVEKSSASSDERSHALVQSMRDTLRAIDESDAETIGGTESENRSDERHSEDVEHQLQNSADEKDARKTSKKRHSTGSSTDEVRCSSRKGDTSSTPKKLATNHRSPQKKERRYDSSDSNGRTRREKHSHSGKATEMLKRESNDFRHHQRSNSAKTNLKHKERK